MTFTQGDKIGWIFASWAIIYFGQFFRSCANFGTTYLLFGTNFGTTHLLLSAAKVISTQNGLGHFLGYFFANVSGHPAFTPDLTFFLNLPMHPNHAGKNEFVWTRLSVVCTETAKNVVNFLTTHKK
jgi:hypothetical protein